MKYKVNDIEWCVDDIEDLDYLPNETEIDAEDEDSIADALSDKYCFLVNSFSLDTD